MIAGLASLSCWIPAKIRRFLPRDEPLSLSSSSIGLKKLPNYSRHPLNLRVGKFGVNRQAEALAGGFFGDREVARVVSKMGVSLLQMQRQWVMQRAADVILLEPFLEFVAPWVAHHIEVPGAFSIVGLEGQPERYAFEQLVVTMSYAATLLSPLVQVLKFDSKHGALDSFHAVIVADLVVIIALA